MKVFNYTLPEFVLLDGNSHEGNALEDREVLQHIRSSTILEIVPMDFVKEYSFRKPTHPFEYRNVAGVVERYMFVCHFSMLHDPGTPANEDLKELFEECARWYCDYLAWEDGNIIAENKVTGN
jgi:hypothetical protein